jgi:hypothetical protein
VRAHKVLKVSKCRPLRESRDSLDIASWAPFSYPQTILKTTELDAAKLFPNGSWAWGIVQDAHYQHVAGEALWAHTLRLAGIWFFSSGCWCFSANLPNK